MKKTIKILLLENDPNISSQLLFELKKSELPYTTEVIQTRQEYEQALVSLSPDIILADYMLACFDWLSAFKIRQQLSPETPFILVSGAIGEGNVVELIKIGLTDYVLREKLYLLVPKIRRALKEAADRQQKETAQRQLRQREQQLGRIMDLSLDLICTMDQDGRFVTIGAACKTILGYLPQELIGRDALDLVHEKDRKKTLQAIVNIQMGVDLINFENRFIRRDGTPVALLWSVHWSPEEKLRYCIGRDATEIKSARKKIKNSEKRFRTLWQNSSDGFTLSAADGRILERSPSSAKILGQDTAALPDKLAADLIHPDDQPAVMQTYQQVMAQANLKRTVECRYLMPDCSYKWLEITLHNQFREPAVEALVFNYRDITENKMAELALRTSEAKLKQAQTIGQMGSWEINWADKSIIWSDEMYRMMGVEKGAITPSLEASAAFVHPDDREAFYNRFAEISLSLENGSMPHRIIRSDGELRYMRMTWGFEFDNQQRPLGLFGILQDITEQKLAETALEASEEKYRNLFNFSPTPMWVYEEATLAFLDVNEAAIQHYGFSKQEFLAMTLKDIWPPEKHEELQRLATSPKVGPPYYRYTSRHVRKNGEVIDVDIKANPVELDGRKAKLVVATDISERMRYIQAIQEQNQRLREIAWTQSHVVRAPLARMMGLVSLLKGYPVEKVNETNILNLISASAHELDGIIRQIVKNAEEVDNHPVLEA